MRVQLLHDPVDRWFVWFAEPHENDMIGSDQDQPLLLVQLLPVHLAEGLKDFFGHGLIRRRIGWLSVDGVDSRHLGQSKKQGDPLAMVLFLQGAVGPLFDGLMLYCRKGCPAHEAVAVIEVRPSSL